MSPLEILLLLTLQSHRGRKPSSSLTTDVSTHGSWSRLDQEHCGLSLVSRIVGGKEAAVGQFPWMVRLGYEGRNGIDFHCGGSILNSRYVITAAHCFSSQSRRTVVAAGGDGGRRRGPQPQLRRSSKVIVHPDYDEGLLFNDIALIELESPLQLNPLVSPVCLLPDDREVTGEVVMAGWGTTRFGGGGPPSRTLQHINEVVIEPRYCGSDFDRRTQLCVLGDDGTAPCNGDSGGPLLWRQKGGSKVRFYVAGLLSYGPSRCGVQSPDVFTRVGAFLPFILDNIAHGP